jgi:hypothetical protein
VFAKSRLFGVLMGVLACYLVAFAIAPAAAGSGVAKLGLAASPSGWVVYADSAFGLKGFPILVSLPKSWIRTTDSSGHHVLANPSNGALCYLFAKHDGNTLTQKAFFEEVRKYYLAIRKHSKPGTTRWMVIDTGAGRAAVTEVFDLVSHFKGQTFANTQVRVYLLAGGNGYEVAYQGFARFDAQDLPVFERAAKLITVAR